MKIKAEKMKAEKCAQIVPTEKENFNDLSTQGGASPGTAMSFVNIAGNEAIAGDEEKLLNPEVEEEFLLKIEKWKKPKRFDFGTNERRRIEKHIIKELKKLAEEQKIMHSVERYKIKHCKDLLKQSTDIAIKYLQPDVNLVKVEDERKDEDISEEQTFASSILGFACNILLNHCFELQSVHQAQANAPQTYHDPPRHDTTGYSRPTGPSDAWGLLSLGGMSIHEERSNMQSTPDAVQPQAQAQASTWDGIILLKGEHGFVSPCRDMPK